MFDLSKKKISRILIEAVIVGLLLVVVYNPIKYILNDWNNNILLLVSGAIFHIICEYTGVNIWYVKDYNKFLF